ncbi:MFS transporter [Beijerinckia indica]|uniref:Major facilitator superfamily MFS_1 n=1 Tax=Beijerinckia indica subsp. indica (strain ATCC 9039 / DSM 1715 / NCIMB 8712) TaxID=395963 RepID=B2IG00_BEII9|nr:MFS transporter [Beijerinckia indica]ACB95739.1 major facilitator superfamily MFS_1 [Beijerinckia indica subsp. indica ATCC 9039]
MSLAASGQASPFSETTVRWTEFALAVGGFGIGTGEFAIMGLLPNVAEDYAVSVPEAGHVISSYALGVVVGAPIITVIAARLSRRVLLLFLMGLFALGNLASALAPSFGTLLALRFFSGLPHGAYFGVASLVAAMMAGPDKRARAVGRVMLGLTIATLFGTPLATWFGQSVGWRAAFVTVGLIGALTVALIYRFVPADQPDKEASPLRELGALRNREVWLTLGVGAIGFGGMFTVFSYIAPILINVTGMPAAIIPFVLCVFGIGMILGNIIGSRLSDWALLPTIGGLLIWNAFVLMLFTFTAPYPFAALLSVLFVGTNFALVPALQTRLMDVAAEAQTLAAALNHSAFNIANALGAWLGGLAIAAGLGWTSTGWVGALLALGGLAVFGLSLWLGRSDSEPLEPLAREA